MGDEPEVPEKKPRKSLKLIALALLGIMFVVPLVAGGVWVGMKIAAPPPSPTPSLGPGEVVQQVYAALRRDDCPAVAALVSRVISDNSYHGPNGAFDPAQDTPSPGFCTKLHELGGGISNGQVTNVQLDPPQTWADAMVTMAWPGCNQAGCEIKWALANRDGTWVIVGVPNVEGF